jgi:hypothetical protein
MAMQSCRSGVCFAQGRLQRTALGLASDPRGAILGDAAVEVAAAAGELAEDDVMGVADARARATHTLDAVLAAARSRGTSPTLSAGPR